METKSYRVGVKTVYDLDWIFNGLRFATREEAEGYRAALFGVWTSVIETEIFIVEEPANVEWRDGRVIFIDSDIKIKPPSEDI